MRLGDCAVVMQELADESIDLTVTSPPYDNLRKYNGYTFDFETIARQLYRVTKPGGVVVWVVGDATIKGSETGTSFRQALGFMETGFKLHDTMIYRKENYTPLTHKRYEQTFEYMFVFSKGPPGSTNQQHVILLSLLRQTLEILSTCTVSFHSLLSTSQIPYKQQFHSVYLSCNTSPSCAGRRGHLLRISPSNPPFAYHP